METVNKVIESEYDRATLLDLIKGLHLPFTVSLAEGAHRSTAQNRLQRLWVNEIAMQLNDRRPEEVRGECKLRLGVPILRNDDAVFRAKYDRIVKPLPYEQKLELMMEPCDFPVTRIMTARQKTQYLNDMLRYWSGKGIFLTIPPDVETILKNTGTPIQPVNEGGATSSHAPSSTQLAKGA